MREAGPRTLFDKIWEAHVVERLGDGTIGASEVEHVLATQTLLQKKPGNMKVEVSGALPFGTTAKDVALAIVGRTHLMSPAMAVAAAVTGRLADVRELG